MSGVPVVGDDRWESRSPSAPPRLGSTRRNEPVVVASKVVFENPWSRFREDTMRLADGTESSYGVLVRPDFAVVVAWDGSAYWLVEQFRHTVGGRFWECPQGTVNDRPLPGPEQIAATELREETGFSAGRFDVLGYLFSAYGVSTQGFHVVLATDLTPGEPDRELTEADMQAARFTRTEIEAMIIDGRIRDSHTIAALALADRFAERQSTPSSRAV